MLLNNQWVTKNIKGKIKKKIRRQMEIQHFKISERQQKQFQERSG